MNGYPYTLSIICITYIILLCLNRAKRAITWILINAYTFILFYVFLENNTNKFILYLTVQEVFHKILAYKTLSSYNVLLLYETFHLSDCKVFTLEELPSKYVNVTGNAWKHTNLGDCFIWCFETQDCYTFSYDDINDICSIYTLCGTNCHVLPSTSSGDKVYVRHCHGKYIQTSIRIHMTYHM